MKYAIFLIFVFPNFALAQPATMFAFENNNKELTPPRNTKLFAWQPFDKLHEARLSSQVFAWRVLAGWRAVKPSKIPHDPTAAADVTSAEDLLALAIEFRTREPEKQGLVLRFDSRVGTDDEKKLARQTLNFFWQPAKNVNLIEGERFRVTNKPDAPREKRFELITEPIPAKEEQIVGKFYETNNRSMILPDMRDKNGLPRKHPELISQLELMKEIGEKGRGLVYWLMEEDLSKPEQFLLAWLPEKEYWRNTKIASPMLEQRYELEICEPPIPQLAGELRSGLGRLPKGTFEIITKEIGRNHRLIALGRRGLVFETTGEPKTFHIYIHRTTGYDEPIITRGVVNRSFLPKWTDKFNLKLDGHPDAPRHLVSLSVCSPNVWMVPRSTNTTPFHLQPMFANPELWACPVKLNP